MPKLSKSEGGRYMFECPGCGCAHFFDDRWQWNGDFEKPTINPSILVNKGKMNPMEPVCHSFVRDGKIEFLGDCTHALAGQTVELPEF